MKGRGGGREKGGGRKGRGEEGREGGGEGSRERGERRRKGKDTKEEEWGVGVCQGPNTRPDSITESFAYPFCRIRVTRQRHLCGDSNAEFNDGPLFDLHI